jgi:acetoin utilization deacetylase AcuC-like enzyme
VAAIEALCARGGGAIDADTYAVPATWEAALRAAGGAVALVDALLGGEAATGVSALRPPGHHAEPDRAMGFCFFGNVAVAARRATAAHGLERVLIFDWDVHHGNGTNATFHGDADVLFVSIHESPLYPGTGPASDVGVGVGQGYTVNVPVPGGTGDLAYRSVAEHVVGGLIAAWEPQLVLVSAGFDAHRDDPLAGCRVTEDGFAAMTASVRRAADLAGAPVGVVLEGGYDLGALSRSMAAAMPVLVGAETPAAQTPELHPLAARALERLAPYWPGLSAGRLTA